MKITMRDIATQTGVSLATVSNALNDRGGVSDSVRERIFSAAREMGYRRDREASRPTDHVRLIVYRAHGGFVNKNPFFMEMIGGMQSECRKDGVELTVGLLDARQADDFDAQLAAFREEKCAGFILLATEMTPEVLHRFDGFKSPVVVLDNTFPCEDIRAVVIDNRAAGMLAARELVAAGHKTFGYITSSVPLQNDIERREGFAAGLAAHGYELTEDRLWPVSPGLNDTCDDMRRLIRARGSLPDAFFAANDGMAIGCMRAIIDAGYSVPGDVSVIGMDDTEICEVCTPQLTTLRVFRREMGICAARMLLSLAVETPPAIRAAVGVRLIRRGSVRYRSGADRP